jgi:hypothetical protein
VIRRENPLESSNLCQNVSEAEVSALPQVSDDLCTLLNYFARFTLLVIEIHLTECKSFDISSDLNGVDLLLKK